MKRGVLYTILGAAMLAMASCTTDHPQREGLDKAPEKESSYIEGELLVKFTPEVVSILEEAGITRGGELTRSGVPTFDEVLEIVGGCHIERIFPIDDANEARTRANGLHRWFLVRFDKGLSTAAVAARFSTLGEVQKVDFNRTIKRAYNSKATPLPTEKLQMLTATTRATTADPLLSEQWNLINRGDKFNTGKVKKSVAGADVQCEGAWQRSCGDNSVVVAVLDEGIFIEHPDLKENIWINEDEVARSDKDNDNNGYKGDINGYNFVYDSGVITWNNVLDSGHGTHVAGVISAVNKNGEGVSSIAGGDGTAGSGVKIMVCQIFSGNTATSLLSTVRAIKYAADNGAVVLQCSWGYVSPVANIYDWGEVGFATEEEWKKGSPLESDALEYFTHNAGSPNGAIEGGIAVFAGGNESAAAAGYPGAAEGYISVAATAADFTPAVYTNYGPGTTISAPGGDQDYYFEYVDAEHNYGEVGCILSTLPFHISESGYGYMEGTSMACPHVSGVVALAISYATQLRRHLTADELYDLIHETATPIDQYMTGKKQYYRYVADLGAIQPMNFNKSAYKGKMGAGQVNAAELLAKIAGAGCQMRFPNITVAVDGCVVEAPARYFVEVANATFEVEIADNSVASCEIIEGNKVAFKGLKVGSTSAKIKILNDTALVVEHPFNITVRTSANNSGWL
ncbi:MAG: S8 family serine peptidase [Alistipes sp.]|nr:S8 family serine peptidase [Alistipes sp.]